MHSFGFVFWECLVFSCVCEGWFCRTGPSASRLCPAAASAPWLFGRSAARAAATPLFLEGMDDSLWLFLIWLWWVCTWYSLSWSCLAFSGLLGCVDECFLSNLGNLGPLFLQVLQLLSPLLAAVVLNNCLWLFWYLSQERSFLRWAGAESDPVKISPVSGT